MTSILVTGCGGPAGVNTIHAFKLTDPDLLIYGCDTNPDHLLYVKDLVETAFVAPKEQDYKYINFLNRVIDDCGIDLVIPQPDPEVLFLSENREKINAEIILPSKETIRMCQDKALTAEKWGIPYKKIRTHIKHIHNDIEDFAKECGGFPIWLRATKGAGGRASTKIWNVEQGYHWIKFWEEKSLMIEFIVQPFFAGRNFAVSQIWNKGKLISSQARERLEYIYPNLAVSGVTGTPSISRTVTDMELNIEAQQDVLRIDPNPHGIYSIDLMEHNTLIYPTEINAGRFFTTNLFFTTAAMEHNCPDGNLHQKLLDIFNHKSKEWITHYNPLPENLYWVRHIDCPAQLLTKEEFEVYQNGN